MNHLIKTHGKNIKTVYMLFVADFVYGKFGCHSGGAPILDPQGLQSKVTAQDYTGRILSHNGNGK